MERFTTSDGKQYILNLNLGSFIDVEEEMGLNLLNPHMPEKINSLPLGYELAQNDVKLAKVVAVIIRSQLEENETPFSAFYRVIDGVTMKAINEAFFAELKRFFAGRQIPTMTEFLENLTEAVRKSNEEQVGETC